MDVHPVCDSAARKRASRASRDNQHKATDQERDAARKRVARQGRTDDQKAADNHSKRSRMAAMRAAQTDDQKADVRLRDAQRKRAQRARETPLQHEHRLAQKQKQRAEKKYCLREYDFPRQQLLFVWILHCLQCRQMCTAQSMFTTAAADSVILLPPVCHVLLQLMNRWLLG